MAWGGKTHKFGAERVKTDGHSFASKLEAAVYQVLKLRERAGEIEFLQAQDHVRLTDARVVIIPDFKCKYVSSGEIFWVEAKGFETDAWKIKLKLWRFYGPGAFEIWKGSHTNPKLVETVIPKRI